MEKLWNPYMSGIALGIVLLLAFLVLGHGIGASGAASRLAATSAKIVAPSVEKSKDSYFAHYLKNGKNPLSNWIIFEVIGMFLGGLLSAFTGGRFKNEVIKGEQISVKKRMIFALIGGILMGIGARIARGCTSGQALSGGALLSVGSFIFMLSVFAGGYFLAYFIRRSWL